MTPTTFKITPNKGRVLIKLQTAKDALPKESQILIPGQLKAGDQLLYGEIISVGKEGKFKEGQFVYYSEYSAAQLFQIGRVTRGEMSLGESQNDLNVLYVVAEDDIMAYEEAGTPIPVNKAKPGREFFT